ncbi:MAG: hypothetical protein JJ863_21830 [Deltaproteobacteria bacterium]|nr:hypothetical protein [Deltaproteobacteria bacterium]
MHLGHSSIGALLGAFFFSVTAHAQLDLVQPQCMPEWWASAQVASALDVELGARPVRIAFVVDEPCDTGTIVSVLVEAEDGRRRRSIDLGDLPAQARPRAIAMGVAAMLRAPAEAEIPPPDALPSEEPTAGEAVEETEAGEARTEPDAPSTDGADEAATPVDPVEEAVPELPAPGAPEATSGVVPESTPNQPSRRPWSLTLSGVGLWTSSRTPWFGAGGSLEHLVESGWSLRIGVDGARTEASDALGVVRGRLVATHLGAAWRHEWDRLHLGARAAVVAEWIHLAGRNADDGVQTEARSRWSASAELTLLVEVPLGRRVSIAADIGVRVTPWGLSASSPNGTVLAVRNASGLARFGLSVRLP